LIWKLLALLLLTAALGWWVARGYWRKRHVAHQIQRARSQFASQRERLEGEFLEAAAQLGKPRGLRWVRADLTGPPAFAVDRVNGSIFALVGVIIGFEAIEGGGMEEVEAVANLRNGSAVFCWQSGRWTTDGRAVMNLSPADAIEHYKQTLARVADDDFYNGAGDDSCN
jgi:hypothetical protein